MLADRIVGAQFDAVRKVLYQPGPWNDNRPFAYLRTHTDRETIALMVTTVLDYLLTVGRNEEAIKVADVILAADPKEGYTMVKKGSAIGAIMKSEFYDKYPTPSLIPASLRPRYLNLAAADKKAFDDAEALGWEPSQ